MSQTSKQNETKGGAFGSALISVKGFVKKIAKSKAMEVIKKILLAVLLLGGSFIVGRKTVHYDSKSPEIKYLPGDTVKITKYEPVPYAVTHPADTANIIEDCIKSGKFSDLFPTRTRDSIVYVSKEDTAAVVKDWAAERLYNETIFDADTVGTANVSVKVQYNRLMSLESTFVPANKNTTITKVVGKKYAPFVGAGVTTMPSYIVNAGMFFEDKYGVSAMMLHDWEKNKVYVGGTVIYKF